MGERAKKWHAGDRAHHSGRSCDRTLTAQVFVAASDEGTHFGVRDTALEHPEAAIRMNVADATGAKKFFGGFNTASDFRSAFNNCGLDVDHAKTQADFRIEIFEACKFVNRPASHFEHDVISFELVEKIEQGGPRAFLNRLSAVISETEMDGFFPLNRAEHVTDGGRRP